MIVTFGAVLFSIYQKSDKAYMLPAKSPRTAAGVSENQRQLTPARPEDYGMVVTNNDAPVLTQGYWDGVLIEKIKDLKAQDPNELLGKINKKIKESQSKSQEKMALIEDNIKKFSDVLAKDPNDPRAKERLEHFLILKSIAKELPDNE